MQSLNKTMLLVVVSQLIIFGLYPFMDTTEARYADIARRMLENKDWITPWFEENIPFWGKPPLSFWLTLSGFNLFGVNEFGGRFFYWTTSIAVLYLLSKTARLCDKNLALTSPAILLSCLLFYIASSAVMTDMPLLLGATLALYAQISAIISDHSKSFNSIFLGLGIAVGMLAKGPISLILFLIPFLIWIVFGGHFYIWRNRFNFLSVFVIAFGLSIPWYLIAEFKTPGFFEYFFIGEHWNRYLIPGWKGDLYGSAHDYPMGSIWLFFLLAIMPWTLILPLAIFVTKNQNTESSKTMTHVRFLLWVWTMIPLVFFTFSGNVLWTYVLPALPATAILIASYLQTRYSLTAAEKLIQCSLLMVVGIKLLFLAYLYSDYRIDNKTTKYLIEKIKNKNIPLNQVYFLDKVPFSAKFYSGGQVKLFDYNRPPTKGYQTFYLVLATNKPKSLDVDLCEKQLLQTHGYRILYCRN